MGAYMHGWFVRVCVLCIRVCAGACVSACIHACMRTDSIVVLMFFMRYWNQLMYYCRYWLSSAQDEKISICTSVFYWHNRASSVKPGQNHSSMLKVLL